MAFLNLNNEVFLSLAIIVLCTLAIIVYIVSGAGIGFYALFFVALVVVFFTWYKVSRTPAPSAASAAPAKKAAKKRKR